MTKQVQRRRGTATQHTSFTGAEGELSVNTTNKSVHVHDNVTAGGFEAARADMDNVTSSSILTAAGITATTAELNYVDGVTSSIQTQLDGKAGTASPTFTGTLTTANLTATGTTTLAGASTSADITFGDNDKATFGAGSDLQIYHDGSDSIIRDVGTGDLRLRGTSLAIEDSSGNEFIRCSDGGTGGTVFLKHLGAIKLATTSTGIDVTGNATFDDNGKAIFGASSDLQIYHDGNNSYVKDSGTGNLVIGADTFTYIGNSAGTTTAARFNAGGAQVFNHNNAQKLATTSTGIDVTGTVTADGLTVDGDANLNGFVDVLSTTDVSGTDVYDEMLRLDNTSGRGAGSGIGISFFQGTNERGRISSEYDDTGQGLHFYSRQDGQGLRERLAITGRGDISFYEDTGTTAKFFWDASAESLSIGSPSADNVTIYSTDDVPRLEFEQGGTVYADIGHRGASAGARQNIFEISTKQSEPMAFRTNNTERMRLDASGNLLLGKTASDYSTTGTQLSSNGQVTFTSDGNTTLQINRKTSDGVIQRFSKDGSTVGSIASSSGTFQLVANTNLTYKANIHTFDNAAGSTEYMRIDSSGNLLVGTTDANPGNNSGGSDVGSVLDSNGKVLATANSAEVMVLNRQSTNGPAIEIRKDGVNCGEIGPHGGGDLYIGQGGAALQFYSAASSIIPYSATSLSANDAGVNLGHSSYRWNNLYLSGGVYLGGTGSANKLDDYEEGTWTPTLVGLTSETGQTYSTQQGDYTKIGNQVICRFGITMSAAGSFSGGYILLSNLPFTIENTPATVHLGSVYFTGLGQNIIFLGLQGRENDNKAYLWVKTTASGSREYPNTSTIIGNSTQLTGSFTYQTTA